MGENSTSQSKLWQAKINTKKTTVFTINGTEGVIFKLGTTERFTNDLSAVGVINEKGYSSLVLPHTQFIIEEK